MLRPSFTGNIHYMKNPAVTALTTANIIAIDGASGAGTVFQPYAYTATVVDDKEEHNYCIDGQDLGANLKVCFGIFLSAEDTKRNMMFNIQGALSYKGSSHSVKIYPIFGITNATTVTSTLIAQANDLDYWKIISCEGVSAGASAKFITFNTQIVIEGRSDAKLKCLAWVLDNESGAGSTNYVLSSLSMQKYTETTDVFKPDRI